MANLSNLAGAGGQVSVKVGADSGLGAQVGSRVVLD
jgi:hypothetical protein